MPMRLCEAPSCRCRDDRSENIRVEKLQVRCFKKIKLYFIFNVTLSTRFDYLYDGYQQCTESQCKGYSFAVLSTVGVNYYDSKLQVRCFRK